MADKIMPMTEAAEGYDLFDKMKAHKGEIPEGSKSLILHRRLNGFSGV